MKMNIKTYFEISEVTFLKAGICRQLVKKSLFCFTLELLVGSFVRLKAHSVLSGMCLKSDEHGSKLDRISWSLKMAWVGITRAKHCVEPVLM